MTRPPRSPRSPALRPIGGATRATPARATDATPPHAAGLEPGDGAAHELATAPARTRRAARTAGLAPGLHLVAVPIGTADDITLRAIDILGRADLLLAEDTRSLRHLMAIHAIPLDGRRVFAAHDHASPATLARIRGALAEGRSVAFCPEAGSPCISDPGHALVQIALEGGHAIHVAPGPSSVLAALAISGLPSERFLFVGFPPARAGARAAWIAEIGACPATLVICESPRRVRELLRTLAESLGETRDAAVCRELTKKFEEVRRGSLGDLARAAGTLPERGEYVVLIDRPRARAGMAATAAEGTDLDAALTAALGRLPPTAAAAEVARSFGLSRRTVYARALALRAASGGQG